MYRNDTWGLSWPDAVTPTLLAAFEARATAEGIEVRWELGDPGALTETWLERADAAEGPWSQTRLERSMDGTQVVALDREVEPGRSYFYRLRGITRGGEFLSLGSLSAMAGEPIAAWELGTPRPNPTRVSAAIDYAVPRHANLRLSVFDLAGREVEVLARGPHPPGRYRASWNARTERGALAPGLYMIRLASSAGTLSRKLVVAR